jgi:molecular chaperone IbpA
MRTFDLTPLSRSTIGFDCLFALAKAVQHAAEETYPPYNIERTSDDRYAISLALAGFSPDEIAMTAGQNVLAVEGSKPAKDDCDFPRHLEPAI